MFERLIFASEPRFSSWFWWRQVVHLTPDGLVEVGEQDLDGHGEVVQARLEPVDLIVVANQVDQTAMHVELVVGDIAITSGFDNILDKI